MEKTYTQDDLNLAARLKDLRVSAGLSLDELAQSSDVSRATLSRIENGDVSPTTHVLGKLCTAYGLTLSRLLAMAESDFVPVVTQSEQPVWVDTETGFRRRVVSPPSNTLSCEVLECDLSAGTFIEYSAPPSPGLEHHLVVLAGALDVDIEGKHHSLQVGDCLRYILRGHSSFRAHHEMGARYHLVII